jgi:hypothetical protein
MKTNRDKNPLLARLRAVSSPTDAVPPNFKTIEQWAREWGMQKISARRLLTQGTPAVMQRRLFRIRLDDGRTFPIPHYAEK